MALSSMTGFGRATGENEQWRWAWEVRSVNGRGLDVRTRIPVPFDGLETQVRTAIQRRLKRGSVSVTLTLKRLAGATGVEVNDDVLAAVLQAADRIRKSCDATPPSVDGLLALKGVLETVEHADNEADQSETTAAMLKDLDAALEQLLAARVSEGEKLFQIITAKIAEIADLTASVANSPARHPDAIRARIKEQVARLLEPGAGLDETRLHQEAVLLATRSDIEEEIKRLDAHVAAAKALLQETGPVGRQFDFLAQELNREANTVCSKAGSNDISKAGLGLKTAIDQMREQVQNIE